ncbi:kinesin light chain-like protein [Minicystis rosea]|nr:kinesin light chain-like protein [Minicystis rosea]
MWWIRAEQPATLAADFADLAAALRLPGGAEQDQRAAIDAVKHWLARSARWLLIFDSVRDPRDLVEYLVPGAPGQVLVTSRHASWVGIPKLHLRELRRQDAVRLLLSRSAVKDRTTKDQSEAAGRLADALGDLPLALAQAAAFMEEHALTVEEYAVLFRERQQDLMRRGAAHDTAPTVATTWDLAFTELSSRAPAAAELLALSAFFAPDDIPKDALRDGHRACPPALSEALRDPIKLGDQIAALRRYSLIEAQDDALVVHRLVQAVVRERLTDEERKAWALCAASLLDQIFPTDIDDKAVWPRCRRLIPHVRTVAERAGAAGVAEDVVEHVLHRAADYSRNVALWLEARDLYMRALGLATPRKGEDHPEVGKLLRSLALTLSHGQIGDPAEARRLAERALAIHVAAFGEDAEVVARDHGALVWICRAQSDWKARSYHLEREIAIYEKIYGRDDARLFSLYNDRGFVLQRTGDKEGARKLFERALAIGIANNGADDPDVATIHSNLASVLDELGERAAARRHAERAVAIGEKCYGPDHYAVAIRRNNLGVLLKGMGELEAAREEIERALAIAQKAYPAGHKRLDKLAKNLNAVNDEIAAKAAAAASAPASTSAAKLKWRKES